MWVCSSLSLPMGCYFFLVLGHLRDECSVRCSVGARASEVDFQYLSAVVDDEASTGVSGVVEGGGDSVKDDGSDFHRWFGFLQLRVSVFPVSD